jgi:hypothetical protein
MVCKDGSSLEVIAREVVILAANRVISCIAHRFEATVLVFHLSQGIA